MWLLPTFLWPGEPLPVEPIFPLNLIGGKFPEDPNAEAKGRYTYDVHNIRFFDFHPAPTLKLMNMVSILV